MESLGTTTPDVGDLDAHPIVKEIFDRAKDDNASYDKGTALFLNTFDPFQLLGAGAHGIVYSAIVESDAIDVGDNEEPTEYVYIRKDGSIGVGKKDYTDLPLTMAVKMQFLGIDKRTFSEKTMANVKAEEEIYRYLSDVTVGKGSDLYSHSPYIKLFSAFNVKLDCVSFFKRLGGVMPNLGHWTGTIFWSKIYMHILQYLPNGKDFDEHRAHPDSPINNLIIPIEDVREYDIIFNVQIFELSTNGDLHSFFTRTHPIPRMIMQYPAEYFGKSKIVPMLLHCLCTLHLFHAVVRGSHFDARPANWILRRVDKSCVFRYDVASNLTFFIPSSATENLVPVLADFGSALIETRDLTPLSQYGSRKDNLDNPHGRENFVKYSEGNKPVVFPDPEFDLQLFAMEFLEITAHDVLINLDYRLWQILTRMIDIYTDRPRTKDTMDPYSVYSALLLTLDNTILIRKRGLIPAEQISLIKKLVDNVKWHRYNQELTRKTPREPTIEAQIFGDFIDLFQLFTFIKLDQSDDEVIDCGPKIGHVSGATLPYIPVSRWRDYDNPPPFAPFVRRVQNNDDAAAAAAAAAADSRRRSSGMKGRDSKRPNPSRLTFSDCFLIDAKEEISYLEADEVDQSCWNCERELDPTNDATMLNCAQCNEAIYCSENCMIIDADAHAIHERCHRHASLAGGIAEEFVGNQVSDEDRKEVERESKIGEQEMSKRGVKKIKTSRLRRIMRFLIRQSVRAAETTASAIGGVFGLDTVVDIGVFSAIEFPAFIAPILSLIRSGSDLGKFLKFFVTTKTIDGNQRIGPFEGGLNGVEQVIQPMIDKALGNSALKKLLQRLCSFIDSIADKIAGSLASALEVMAVEFFGIARFSSYQALYGAFTRGSKTFAATLKKIYNKMPEKIRKYFENFEMTVELIAKLKEKFMKTFQWVAKKAPAKFAKGIRHIEAVLEKMTPYRIALALHSVLSLGYVALLVRARCQ
jgi:predicted RNA-binding Zn-ribbon protein involved in translation (DUF1610 family)